MDSILVPISVGELFDKISILKIKEQKITNPIKLQNIKTELNLLQEISKAIDKDLLSNKVEELYQINILLWDIEEKKRKKEKQKKFDEEFIQLARDVYINNDKRASIKKDINILLNSNIIEEKSYE